MTESQLAENLLTAVGRRDWPDIQDRVDIKVHLRSGEKRGLAYFKATEMTGQRVRIEWHLSPWSGKSRFKFAANEAFRAAYELLHGLTSAAHVAH